MKLPARSLIQPYWRVAALVLALPCLMGAEIYRWVDENGVVNYTQQRPSNIEVEQITTRTGGPRVVAEISASTVPSATPTPPANQQGDLTEDQQRMLEGLRQAETTRREEVAKIRTANCNQARTTLDDLQARGRIRVSDGDTVRVMDEDERQQRISDAQEGITVNCDA